VIKRKSSSEHGHGEQAIIVSNTRQGAFKLGYDPVSRIPERRHDEKGHSI
jgi:hypothetical protein